MVQCLRSKFEVDPEDQQIDLPSIDVGEVPTSMDNVPRLRFTWTRKPDGKGYTQTIHNIPTALLALAMRIRAYIDVTREKCGPDAKIDRDILEKFDGEIARKVLWGNNPRSWGEQQKRLYNLFYAGFEMIYYIQKASMGRNEVIPLSEMEKQERKVQELMLSDSSITSAEEVVRALDGVPAKRQKTQ